MSCKITLIGAGSVVFAKTLVGDILQFPELSDATICLMDIDPDRLKVADHMMKKMVRQLGVSAKIESTLNQRKAIKGAKYVICTIQVGGFKPCTVTDFEIPKKYGLRQTIADTLGVGGVFRALRTIPVINQIARDIADVGHRDCLFLNYSNPMAMNCWAVDRAVGIPHVGLCHSVFGTARMLAKYAGIPFEDLSYLVAGVNHMAFFLKFQYKGQDAYPLLFKALEDPSRRTELVRFEMMRRLGYFVTESSEHQSEYVPHFIPHGEKVIEDFGIPLDEYIRRCEAILATWESEEKKLLGGDRGEMEIRPQSHEYGSYIIHSIETDTLRTVYGNVPNRHIIDNLLQGCNVEVPCQVDGTGLNPVRIGELPPQLAAICMSQINVQNLTVEAALTAKREHIYHAVMADPNTAATLTLDRIWAMCDELIEAHQRDGYLGEFSPTFPNSGRGFAGIGDRAVARLEGSAEFSVEAGAVNSLRLDVENPGDKELRFDVALRSGNPDLRIQGKSRFRLVVPAGETVTRRIETSNRARLDGVQKVALEVGDDSVLTIDATLRPREVFRADEDGRVDVGLDLNGFDAVAGSLRLGKRTLDLEFEVADSDIKPDPDSAHLGSDLKLFVAQDGRAPITQVTFTPRKGRKGLLVQKRGTDQPVKARAVSLKVTKMNYRFSVSIPLAELGIEGGKDFLFDVIASLSALGDAHSGGRCSLSGGFDSFKDSSRFALFAQSEQVGREAR